MNWFIRFMTSSLGQKLVMSLTGLFLVTFLIVHLIGNLQLLAGDGGESFNLYAKFMTSNPFIKATSYGLYAFILLHAVQGLMIWIVNKSAKGKTYLVKTKDNASFASQNMAWLGIILALFLGLHLYQFWLQMKMDWTPMATYDGVEVKDLYKIVSIAFANPIYVIIYVISMIAVGLHLSHGIQSGFQTLGLNHKKYNPVIKFVGMAISIVLALGFSLIPIWMYFTNS